MIDIHTHILPGIDDGAEQWQDTLDLVRAAQAEGISTLIATPHHANGRFNNPALEVIEHTRRINEQLLQEGLSVTILPGQEIRIHNDLLDAWSRGELLPLGQSNYVLIEMPSSNIPKGLYEFLHEFRIMGLSPVIAHPERNAEIMQHPQRLAELITSGAYAQVTSHSLVGGFGRKVEKLAWSLCREGLIHIVSSDAHHVERRGFRLREAYDLIEMNLGQQWVTYFMDNALCIVENRQFEKAPISISSRGLLHRMFSRFSS